MRRVGVSSPEEEEWPRWSRFGAGAFGVGLGLAIAIQRHVFTAPSLAAVLVVAATLPWAVDLWGVDLLRRRSPRVQAALCSAVVIGATFGLIVGYPSQYNDFAPFFLVLLAGTMGAAFGLWYGVVVGLVSVAGLVSLDLASVYGGAVIWSFAIAAGVLGGAAAGAQIRVSNELRAAQSNLAERVATGERQRLAREIHDLVAHSLAVTMLHLTGARLALKDGETDEAIDALDEAERTGREAMAEIRRTVGLLGPVASGAATSPTPKAADVPALVGDFRAAGLVVEARLNGTLESVPLTAGVALYRIVQESLSNAVKHASGQPVRLEVDVGSAVVRATISNPLGPPQVSSTHVSDGGHGVRGMSERAKALDGAFQAGSQAGAWVVEATVPMGASGS